MRGKDEQQLDVFSYVSPEQRVPQDQPLRPLRVMTDEALRELQPRFNKLYAKTGRPSIAPEKLLRALLLQALYSVRSERLLRFYWLAQGKDSFSALNYVDPTPSRSASRWDAAEASTYFNFNLTAMDTSVDFVLRVGPGFVLEHNRKLIELLFERLPKDCVPASPLDSAQRGPFGCFTAPLRRKLPSFIRSCERKCCREHARGEDSRLASFVQLRAGH